MVTETTEIAVRVTALRIRLLRVDTYYGHQLVVGGRLVSETRFGEVIPHPDLPEYRREDFPCDFSRWAKAKGSLVVTDPKRMRQVTAVDPNLPKEMQVDVFDTLRDRKLGPNWAALHLFTPCGKEEVLAWLRSKPTGRRSGK